MKMSALQDMAEPQLVMSTVWSEVYLTAETHARHLSCRIMPLRLMLLPLLPFKVFYHVIPANSTVTTQPTWVTSSGCS